MPKFFVPSNFSTSNSALEIVVLRPDVLGDLEILLADSDVLTADSGVLSADPDISYYVRSSNEQEMISGQSPDTPQRYNGNLEVKSGRSGTANESRMPNLIKNKYHFSKKWTKVNRIDAEDQIVMF